MIYFFADDHYEAHPGQVIYNNLPDNLKANIRFFENKWETINNTPWAEDCQLLILNLIGGTCNQPHPDSGAERQVRNYLEKSGNVLLLHGGSAAFWQWDWWRQLVGERWVRPNDPDGAEPSTHPVKPYRVIRSKSRHPLVAQLQEMELPEDEIYTNLENTSPCMRLMETRIEEGTFTQCCEAVTPWGGKMFSFIPGHRKNVTSNPILIANLETIINYLMN